MRNKSLSLPIKFVYKTKRKLFQNAKNVTVEIKQLTTLHKCSFIKKCVLEELLYYINPIYRSFLYIDYSKALDYF